MPTIPKKISSTPKQKTPNLIKRRKVYQSTKWQDLRNAHFVANPLCYICEKMGKYITAEDVHHIKHLENYDGLELEQIAYDPSNLISVCKQHHALLHSEWRGINTIEGIDKAINELNKKNKK